MNPPSFSACDFSRLPRIRRVLDEAGYNQESLGSLFAGLKNTVLSHPVSVARWQHATRSPNPLNTFIRYACVISQ